jgi:predicted 3-demethylubiquinone-9 3-methyltransferase (glyoxalase superfamily)
MLTLEMAIQKIQQFPPEQRNQVIQFVEFLEFQANKTTLEPIDTESQEISFTQAAQEFVGCLDSDIEDLSHNPQPKSFGNHARFINHDPI